MLALLHGILKGINVSVIHVRNQHLDRSAWAVSLPQPSSIPVNKHRINCSGCRAGDDHALGKDYGVTARNAGIISSDSVHIL